MISWSHTIISQLDVGHRNSTSHVFWHTSWDVTSRLCYSCISVGWETEAAKKSNWRKSMLKAGLRSKFSFSLPTGPKYHWLMQAYAQDVLSRLDKVKASITSLFGQAIKMDFAKKIVRKLAGEPRYTAAWVTNVTRRFATGCPTDSHALYSGFMAQVTSYIFLWDDSDLQWLRAAKPTEARKQVTCALRKQMWHATSPKQRWYFTVEGPSRTVRKSCSSSWLRHMMERGAATLLLSLWSTLQGCQKSGRPYEKKNPCLEYEGFLWPTFFT